jgi:2-C-methyl-D-erythritol 4-phosphate cytidylyltransferase
MSARAGDSPVRMSALIPAAGSGERLGRGPKAFLQIEGKPILGWLVEKIRKVAEDVVIAVPEDRLGEAKEAYLECICVAGGATRQETIERMAQMASGDVVLIHDAVRPYCSVELLRRVGAEAAIHGAAGALLPSRVPGGLVSPDGWLAQVYPSAGLVTFQSPQAFRRDVLFDVLAKAKSSGWKYQSTVELAAAAGVPVKAIEGEARNIKITTDDDWILAQQLKEFLT